MKAFFKKIKRNWIYVNEAVQDVYRLKRAVDSRHTVNDACRIACIEGAIIRHYHVIEKGLSMRDFRPRFGVDVVKELCKLLDQWGSIDPDLTNEQVITAYQVICAYQERHIDLGIDIADIIGNFENKLVTNSGKHSHFVGGTKLPLKVDPKMTIDFDRFLKSRSSIRWFIQDRLPNYDVISDAVSSAITTPSVCNRQTWRVHAYSGKLAQKILACQSGNRGFGHQIPMLLVVTSDLCYFTGPTERNQAWVDGGMFAMTLVLALHAKGLGSVCLNWSVNNKRDKDLRLLSKIPDNERVIMIIGVGYPDLEVNVPNSQRKQVREILNIH